MADVQTLSVRSLNTLAHDYDSPYGYGAYCNIDSSSDVASTSDLSQAEEVDSDEKHATLSEMNYMIMKTFGGLYSTNQDENFLH